MIKERIDGWRGWVENGFNQGARNAHLTARLAVEWQATTVHDSDGSFTADPVKLLKDQRRE